MWGVNYQPLLWGNQPSKRLVIIIPSTGLIGAGEAAAAAAALQAAGGHRVDRNHLGPVAVGEGEAGVPDDHMVASIVCSCYSHAVR